MVLKSYKKIHREQACTRVGNSTDVGEYPPRDVNSMAANNPLIRVAVLYSYWDQ